MKIDPFMVNLEHKPRFIHITGGRGRLATIVALHLRSLGFSVNLFSRTPGLGFYPLSQLLEDYFVGSCDTILHMGWSTLPVTSEANPGIEYVHDLPLLVRLLDKISSSNAKYKPHLIFFSSGGAVYGNALKIPSSEKDECSPIGAYGRAKLNAERLIDIANATPSYSCAILRISNPYGFLGDLARPQGLVNKAIACSLTKEELVVWGDGTARKDYLYESDFLSALVKVIQYRLEGVFNLCFGHSISVDEVLQNIESCTGRKVIRRYTTAPEWDVQNSLLDGRSLSNAIDWSPNVPFSEGVRLLTERFVLNFDNTRQA